MTDSRLEERLRSHRLLAAIPGEEIAWVAARARSRHFPAGKLLSSQTTGLLEELLIIVSARISVWADRGAGARKVMEWGPGEVSGRLPYSRQIRSAGEVRVEEAGEIVMLHRELFPQMIRDCPELTARLVQLMVDRARHFTRHDLHDEKMASLGRLSAGLAHELDNPASALVRGAKLLLPALAEADSAARAIGELPLSPEQRVAIETLRDRCVAAELRQVRSPLEQARHEEDLEDWLENRGADPTLAEALAETPITLELLDTLGDRVGSEALDVAIRWLATGCRSRSLAADLGKAATRISELVRAVKGFTYMDNDVAPGEVDVAEGLSQAVTMLRTKAREKEVAVSITVPPDLPRVRGVGGELNQVWANLIDNALDAAGAGGSVRIEAIPRNGGVRVSVVDDGAGIPAEIQDRIFEPFFTTKPVGQGTGLGLDIVRRLVMQNSGRMELSSTPGRTEFHVILPAAGSAQREV